MIETAKLNDVDPRAWLAGVLARLPDHPAKPLKELWSWNWAAAATAADIADLVEAAAPKPGPRGPYKNRISN